MTMPASPGVPGPTTSSSKELHLMTVRPSLALAALGLPLLAALAPHSATAQSQNCADVLARDSQLGRAVAALSRTGILDNLRISNPVTIFAVTDAGIDRQPQNLSQALFPQAGSAQGGSDIDPVMAPRW